MTSEFSGGLDPQCEFFLNAKPDNPQLRDSASLWVMDESGKLAFPRITIDAIGSHWERPNVQINFALADGRALRVWSDEPMHPVEGAGPRTSLGAGPLRFECIEPFRRWLIHFRGWAEQTTTHAQLTGERGGAKVALAFRFEAHMAAPPWLMGAMSAETARKMRSGAAGALMGGVRYEQLCRVTGTVDLAGERHRVNGTGMRVRRQGIRSMGAATGHCQHSALFPSGRAFGVIAFAPGPDGAQTFNEGFVFTGHGRPLAAKLVKAPWMKRLVASGDDATLELESERGTIRIEGTTVLSTFDQHLFEMADSSVLSQGTARYVWDGEETIGLIERCTRREQLQS